MFTHDFEKKKTINVWSTSPSLLQPKDFQKRLAAKVNSSGGRVDGVLYRPCSTTLIIKENHACALYYYCCCTIIIVPVLLHTFVRPLSHTKHASPDRLLPNVVIVHARVIQSDRVRSSLSPFIGRSYTQYIHRAPHVHCVVNRWGSKGANIEYPQLRPPPRPLVFRCTLSFSISPLSFSLPPPFLTPPSLFLFTVPLPSPPRTSRAAPHTCIPFDVFSFLLYYSSSSLHPAHEHATSRVG